MPRHQRLLLALAWLALPTIASAQTFHSPDSIIRSMWRVGMEQSQLETLAGGLIDSIGPRLSGSPGFASAVAWLEDKYKAWGIPARREQYGTYRGWKQGTVHMEMVAPRMQNLDVKLLAWSPPTPKGAAREADVVTLPDFADAAAARQWVSTVRGKFVLLSAPEIMCRAPQELARNARPATVARINAQRADSARVNLARRRLLAPANTPDQLVGRAVTALLDSSGVLGIGSLTWSGGWGVNKVFGTSTKRATEVDVSCEDYGLLYRLATRGIPTRVRLTAESQETATEVPMFNVIAELKGTELPNEYVVLSAHLDSWGSATGATDNGTGTLTMLEAMRILKETYPHPRRTILVGHWGGEEIGAIGSLTFGEDHPDVINGLQVAFNQDNGTWRAELIEGQGFLKASANLARWVAQLPSEMTDSLRLQVPGPQANSGSDHTSFICRGAPAFRLQSSYSEYRQYTWHTNRDTYDKIVFDDLRNNATLAAMLAYAASEDPERTSREVAFLPPSDNGQARKWPECPKPPRSFAPVKK
jgi:carboxypeptidase Q